MDAANRAGGANTITLAAGATFALIAVNNTTDGPTGLPAIAARNDLTIVGQGATIARSTAAGTPAFRLFAVADRASLTLDNLTLANGLALGDTGQTAYGGGIFVEARGALAAGQATFTGNQSNGGDCAGGPGGMGYGGAIQNEGTASLEHCTFTGNRAVGGALAPGAPANSYTACWGGALTGLFGALQIRDSTFVGNEAVGCAGSAGGGGISSSAGSVAAGGAIEINWGQTATILNCRFSDNSARGGAGANGAPGGAGVGGGIDASASSIVTVTGCAFGGNQAIGGAGGSGANGGDGLGGGLSVGSGVLYGDPDTSALTLDGGSLLDGNRARGGDLGGNARGGGLHNMATTALVQGTITRNKAQGGAAQGGGVFNDGQISIGPLMLIYGNRPDDCVGCTP